MNLRRISPWTIWLTVCVLVAGLVVAVMWQATQVRTITSYYNQSLDWSVCDDAECSVIEVPLDYEDLDAGTLRLDVQRVRATGSHGRSLFVNPGGPGLSAADWLAVEVADTLTKPMRARFDVVALDPRGTGGESLVDCVSDRDMDRVIASDPSPDDAAEVEEFRREIVTFNHACVRSAPRLARHVSTEEAARDMDIARAAVGATRLDYLGYSYGTQLGATYATLFPESVGRMVLDGAYDPSTPWIESWTRQSAAFDLALSHFVADCLRRSCPLGQSQREVFARIIALLATADRDPIPASGDPDVSEGWAFFGLISGLYSKDLWPDLRKALVAAQDGYGNRLRSMAYDYVGRDPDGTYWDHGLEVNPVIACNDAKERPSMLEVANEVPRFVQGSPVMGRADAWGLLTCSGFPPPLHPQVPIQAAAAEPMLVLGSTGDPATPIADSRALARKLGSSVFLERDGEGHTSYGPEHPCTVRHVNRYFLRGLLPRPGTTCTE